MNKKAQLSQTFVRISAITIGFLIILFVVAFPVREAMTQVAEKGQCQWEFFISSQTKILGQVQIPPECESNRLNITEKLLEKDFKDSRETLNTWKKDRDNNEGKIFGNWGSNFIDDYEGYQSNHRDDDVLYEYSMDAVVADEIKDCWEKVLKGKFPLFDEWWQLIGTEEPDDSWWEVWNLEKKHPPTFCVLCSVVSFDKDINQRFPEKVSSINNWMKNTPVLKDPEKTDYFSYTLPEDQVFYEQDYSYYTDRDLAIIYSRVNVHKIDQWGDMMMDWINIISEEDKTEVAHAVMAIPYEKVKCDYMIG